MRLPHHLTANALVCTRACDDSVHDSDNTTAQMVVTGKVHNRLQRGSCDSERRRDAGRNRVRRLETIKRDTGSLWIYCIIEKLKIMG